MAMNNENLNPPWLSSILSANFFEPCKTHKHSNTTHFCTSCSGDSLCINCLAENYHHQHPNHNIISACVYLSFTAIKTMCIRDPTTALAFSDIQTYDTNNIESPETEKILLVNQLPQNIRQSISSHHKATTCVICRQGLSKPFFRFCSIECKAKSIDGHVEPEEINPRVHVSSCGLRKRRV